MPLVARVQHMDGQVAKIVIEGTPLSDTLAIEDVLAYYEKLAAHDTVGESSPAS